MKKLLVLLAVAAFCLAGSVRATPKDDRVEITGSHIRQKVERIGFSYNSTAPVLVLDRSYIERTGAATVADVLRRLPFARVTGH